MNHVSRPCPKREVRPLHNCRALALFPDPLVFPRKRLVWRSWRGSEGPFGAAWLRPTLSRILCKDDVWRRPSRKSECHAGRRWARFRRSDATASLELEWEQYQLNVRDNKSYESDFVRLECWVITVIQGSVAVIYNDTWFLPPIWPWIDRALSSVTEYLSQPYG